jgi:hypothetical protein
MLPYTDALERALGDIVARARGELDLLKAQADAVVSAAKAKVSEADNRLIGIETRIAERLASVKDGDPGPPGERGPQGVVDMAAVEEIVLKAVEAIPPAAAGEPGKDGRDADMGVVAGMIEERVGIAVAALPPAERGEDGAPGKDADMEELRGLLVAEIGAAVGALPVAEKGEAGRNGSAGVDGRSVEKVDVVQEGRDLTLVFTIGGVEREHSIELPEGTPGKDGETGPAGKDGKIGVVKAWSDTVHYEGDVRTHLGTSYQALRDTGREPPHEDWIPIAERGADGKDGASLNPRRLWEADGEYKRLDLVALNGGSFVAMRDDPGACPGDGWMLLTAQGKRGGPGDKGEPGPRGPSGPAVKEITVDDTGMLTLTNGDGSVATCDLHPLLSMIAR